MAKRRYLPRVGTVFTHGELGPKLKKAGWRVTGHGRMMAGRTKGVVDVDIEADGKTVNIEIRPLKGDKGRVISVTHLK